MVGLSVTMVPTAGSGSPATTDPFVQLSAARRKRLRAIIAQYDPPVAAGLTFPEAENVLLAVLYRALTGVAWQDLPAWAPSPDRVLATFERWRARGLLDRLGAELLIRLDAGERHNP